MERRLRLALMQQAHSARGVGLPALGIDFKRGVEFLHGFAELALTLQTQAQIVVRRAMPGLELGHLRVGERRIAPLLLFEAQVAQAGLDFDRIFALFGGPLQFLHGIVEPVFRGELNGAGQGRRGDRTLFLARVIHRIPAHEPFNQLVVNEKNLLFFIFGHGSSFYLLITRGTTLTVRGRGMVSPRSLYSPTPPSLRRSSVQSSTFSSCTQVLK